MEEEMKEANKDAITRRGLSSRLAGSDGSCASNIVSGSSTWVVGYARQPGFCSSALASNVDSLGKGLAALSQELGGEGAITVVAVVSEFAVPFAENGNKGTDHGHGSVYWVSRGSVTEDGSLASEPGLSVPTCFRTATIPSQRVSCGHSAGCS